MTQGYVKIYYLNVIYFDTQNGFIVYGEERKNCFEDVNLSVKVIEFLIKIIITLYLHRNGLIMMNSCSSKSALLN